MVGILAIATGAASQTPGSDSAANVAAFLSTLRERQLETIAAEYPDEPNRFTAALYLPGSQLLVISATSANAPRLRQLIEMGDYRQVYMDLSTSNDRDGRLFVQDLEADGLHRTREGDNPFDITWENGVIQTIFNGDWFSRGISKAEYDRRFEDHDRRYAELLRVLTSSLLKDSTPSAPVAD
jgi:hypothetical protein